MYVCENVTKVLELVERWWPTPLITALRWQRQMDHCEFEAAWSTTE